MENLPGPLVAMAATLVLCLFLIHAGLCGSLKKSHLRIEKFEQCQKGPKTANRFVNIDISQIGFNKVRIYGDIIVQLEISEPANLKCKIYKCHSKENQDLCEYMYTVKTEKFCDQIGDEKAIWDSFWAQTNLPRECPITPGNYSIQGAQINFGDMLDSSLFTGYWKVKCTGKTKGKTWFCIDADCNITFEEVSRPGNKYVHKKKRRN